MVEKRSGIDALTDATQAQSPDVETGESSDEDATIQRELVALLYENNGIVLAVTLMLALLICVMLDDVVASVRLSGWLVAFIVVTFLRACVLRVYRTSGELYSTRIWHQLFAVGAAGAGLAWGIAAVLFFVPGEPMLMLLLTCLYAIVVAVGTQALSLSLPSFFLFSGLMIGPLMIRLIAAGGDFYQPLGLLGFLYLLSIWAFAVTSNRAATDALKIREENRQLVERLSTEKLRAEESQKRAEQANLAKSHFLAAASHDLRQPLHAMVLYQNALEPHVNQEGKRIMSGIGQTVQALQGLFESLLDISKLDAGVVEAKLKHVPLRSVLKGVCEEFEREATEKGLTFIADLDDTVVHSDALMVERIVRNLLSNAIRNTTLGEVSIRARQRDNAVAVTVADTGCGIPEADFENIFSEYRQLRNPNRDRTRGLGLGLSIVKRLCGLLDAGLSLRSTVGEGSEFEILLPAGDAGQLAVTTKAHAWDLRDSVIVVIDDEPEILQSMVAVLENWGCTALPALTIRDALDAVDRATDGPTAVVADLRLANGESGIHGVERIRDAVDRPLPALLISGDTGPDRLREVRDSGLRLLHKPVSPAELRTALYQEIVSQRSG